MKVGVVLSSFNRPAGLLAAIDSVYAQTHGDWALVVADDHSEDERVLTLLGEAGADPRVTVLRGPKVSAEDKRRRVCTFGALINEGVARLAAAGCELFSYLVDDVVYHPGRLAAHAALLEARPDVFLVWGEQWLVEHDAEGRVVGERYQVPEKGLGERTMEYVRSRLWRNNFINHCSATHRATSARWSVSPRHWQRIDHEFWLSILRAEGARAVFHHFPFVGETMHTSPRDIGPVLQGGGSIADVARMRGGS